MAYGRRMDHPRTEGYVVLITMVILSSLKDRLGWDPFFKWPYENYLLTGDDPFKSMKTYMRSVKNDEP